MATQYEVNISITAGTDFYQSFYMANPDFTATDLTDCKVFGAIAKHSNALNALQEGTKVRQATSFTTDIPDATAGHYSISLDAIKTDELEEGKYVYSVIIEYPDGNLVEATSGLVFVKNAFGIIRNDEDTTPDPDTDVNPGPEPIDPPGSGGDDGGEGTDPGGTPYP